MMQQEYSSKPLPIRFFTALSVLLPCFVFFSLPAHADPDQSPDVLPAKQIESFSMDIAKKHGRSQKEVYDLLKQAQIQPSILSAIARPAEKKPWHEYRKLFLNHARIKGGVKFMAQHKQALDRTESIYGVPPEIITAIIGVETRYGKNKGGYRTIDALATLAFAYPPRSSFFKRELENFLLLVEEQNFDALQLKGSYAGAMGIPQFMPSSYRHYGVDLDGDGVSALIDSTEDAIGSVAYYLQRHGWKRGAPVAWKINQIGDAAQAAIYAEQGSKPSLTFEQIQALKIDISPNVLGETTDPWALLQLEKAPDTLEYWIGHDNFYVITRYNHSILYAMAVFQLAESLKGS